MEKVTIKVMTSSQASPQILHADQEHAGLRTAVFFLLFITLVAAFFGIRALLTALSPVGTPDYAFVASCAGALPLALFLVWLAEMGLKRHWPSGRSITLTNDGLHMQTETDKQWQITQGQEIVPLFYYFEMRGWPRGGRERRVPRTWLCLAVEVKAGKKQAIAFTFMPPNKARSWLDTAVGPAQFHQIQPRDVYGKSIRARMSVPSRPEIPAAVLTGADGSYWLAERRRWTEGFELTTKQFEQFMNHIQTTLLEL